MTPRLLRLLLPLALAACVDAGPGSATQNATVPLGIDLGGSGPVAKSPRAQTAAQTALAGKPASHPSAAGPMQMAHDGHSDAHATGTVNSIDVAQHKINLSHQPIPEIGWPAMTMDFVVAPAVDLRSVKPGARVNFTIEKGQGGMYEIQAIRPAGGG